MSSFNQFGKKDKPKYITLPQPDDSLSFLEVIKVKSEKHWTDTLPNKNIYGFQIQPNTQWKRGLNEQELKDFETVLGITFPTSLRNFYQTMNGLTKPGINLYGDRETPTAYRSVFYSYPDDLSLIREMIEWIYESTSVKKDDLVSLAVSGIFPIHHHRFMLVDFPGNPILSMYGDDIVYWADNLSKLLANELFDNIYNISDFESSPHIRPTINFWLD